MDGAQCRGLVEQTCPPSLPWDTLAALGRRGRWREAASGQLYPACSEATRLALTRAQWLAWQRTPPPPCPPSSLLPPPLHPFPTSGEVLFFSFFFAAQFSAPTSNSSEQCGRIYVGQAESRKSLTWSKTLSGTNAPIRGRFGGSYRWPAVKMFKHNAKKKPFLIRKI